MTTMEAFPTATGLLGATLETWCHHLLYVRNVYPRETFCNSYFLGVRCKACRHKSVVDYISAAVKVAVPALVGKVADDFLFEIIDEKATEISDGVSSTKRKRAENNSQDTHQSSQPDSSSLRAVSYIVMERFVLRISNWTLHDTTTTTTTSKNDIEETSAKLQSLERGLRDLILKLSSLDRDTVKPSSTLSFKIQLRLNERHNKKTSCSEVQQALVTGSWFRSSSESVAASAQSRPRLPLFQVSSGDCDISCTMLKRLQSD